MCVCCLFFESGGLLYYRGRSFLYDHQSDEKRERERERFVKAAFGIHAPLAAGV